MMGLVDFVEAATGLLFGADRVQSGIEDHYDASRAKMDDAVARGWRSALYSRWPRDAEKIWIWRVEWDFPSLVDPRDMNPEMNANGLWWKPWRESDPASTAPLEITGDRGDER